MWIITLGSILVIFCEIAFYLSVKSRWNVTRPNIIPTNHKWNYCSCTGSNTRIIIKLSLHKKKIHLRMGKRSRMSVWLDNDLFYTKFIKLYIKFRYTVLFDCRAFYSSRVEKYEIHGHSDCEKQIQKNISRRRILPSR